MVRMTPYQRVNFIGQTKMMVLFLAMTLALGHAVPVSNSPNEVEKYLQRFGYLIKDNTRIGSNNTENELKEALPKLLQKFGGIVPSKVVDGPTSKPIESRRCGVDKNYGSDNNNKKSREKRFSIQAKWNKLTLTWSMVVPVPNGLDYDEIREEITRALNVWAKHSKLVFVEKINSDDVDIMMSFQPKKHGDGNDFDGMGGVVAHAFLPYYPNFSGDIHFDADEDWTIENTNISSKTHLFTVAVHEIGHSLGLGDTSTEDSVMYPIYNQLPTDYELPLYDRQNIQQLYGFTENEQEEEEPQTEENLLRGSLSIVSGEFTCLMKLSNNESETIDGYFEFDKTIDHVDAVYQRSNGYMVFFIGNEYYVFDESNKLKYSRPLTDFGLPHDLEKIDAVMIWKHDNGTYFFSGYNYWKFNEDTNSVEGDYPRDIRNLFGNVSSNIDAAFNTNDGTTYFFKGRYFWQFDDARRKIVDINPKLSSEYWMDCP